MDRAKFFAAVRSSLFGGKLSQDQVSGMDAILDAVEPQKLPSEFVAYMFATTFHETARTMQPIEEYGKGKGRKYGVPAGPFGKVYYGRGDVQLTWLQNYEKAKAELGLDFVQHPELALDPHHAAEIMIKGMTEGWFTGKKLSDYFHGNVADWVSARRIINGTDRANDIAGYGRKFLAAIDVAA